MLRAEDPLPRRPRRILVAGVSGTGKTTLAGRVAQATGVPHTEIDSLFHGPDWTPRPQFMAEVSALVAGPCWITEWQYGEARPLLAEHADLLIWLDLPFTRVTLPRVVRRTLRRRLQREELWNGNVEPPLRTILHDPEHIVRWAVRIRRKYRTLVPDLEGARPDLAIVRLRTTAEVERWLRGPLREALG
ncbi:AAA family ATPase [Allobranchiibius sp. CTAmp26]|uniref:AAA family ATPase n=1 Tax=Allobranchiibius sp. CTAmp26 TaxID=2815214 RepID=UPI001AA16965|nr:AAA family ATPase [Allobranchiibius sp. CTAmp26]MBO1754923.1 AAA family ATPase [Allobranchiibius sp. CTAmp26]